MASQRELNYLLLGVALGGLAWAAGEAIAKHTGQYRHMLIRREGARGSLKGLSTMPIPLLGDTAVPPARTNEAHPKPVSGQRDAGLRILTDSAQSSSRVGLASLDTPRLSPTLKSHSDSQTMGASPSRRINPVRRNKDDPYRASELGGVQFGYASWYDHASCEREGTSGVMANGQPLDDEALTAAMWGVPFGTRVMVTNLDDKRHPFVIVTCQDRGPGKRARKRGVIIDLSRAAFSRIASLREGIVRVRMEVSQ